jgi:hypothetical protein
MPEWRWWAAASSSAGTTPARFDSLEHARSFCVRAACALVFKRDQPGGLSTAIALVTPFLQSGTLKRRAPGRSLGQRSLEYSTADRQGCGEVISRSLGTWANSNGPLNDSASYAESTDGIAAAVIATSGDVSRAGAGAGASERHCAARQRARRRAERSTALINPSRPTDRSHRAHSFCCGPGAFRYSMICRSTE